VSRAEGNQELSFRRCPDQTHSLFCVFKIRWSLALAAAAGDSFAAPEHGNKLIGL